MLRNKQKVRIGTNGFGYTQNRNFVRVPLQKYVVTKSPDVFSVGKVLYRRLVGTPPQFLRIWHLDFGLGRCPINHFFNAISFSRTPWVVTFGWVVPRLGGNNWRKRVGVPRLASLACKKLIATSNSAKQLQMEYLSDYPSYIQDIEAKICVLHPPQPVLVDSIDEKPTIGDHVHCTFVGHEFYRKGGFEVLTACDELWNRGYAIKLNIVSNLSAGKTGTQYHRDERIVEKTIRLLDKNQANINHYPSLPNSEVVELFRKSHIGLLPTFFDEFGYSALEAQASGCSVVTTGIMALAEINDNSCGWVIDVACDDSGRPKLRNRREINESSERIIEGVKAALADAAENPGALQNKCRNSLDRIRRFHDPLAHAQRLEHVYDEILMEHPFRRGRR